ncbi:MAG: peptidoglycan DD-metalloendopeptidase family protein, partial [Candidatus Limnocylindria bacterium]
MRRRSRLSVTFVALVIVGWSVVTTQPSGSALAADPEAELAQTQQQLADAQSAQQSLEAAAARQRDQLAQLKSESSRLEGTLNAARAELQAVTNEYERVSALLVEIGQQVIAIEAHIVELRRQIAALDAELMAVANDIVRRTADLEQREALLQSHMRSAYERTQTSILELLLAADSLDTATTQMGYLMTVAEEDRLLADEIRAIRAELETHRATLRDGRRALTAARRAAREEEELLKQRQAELAALEAELARLRAEAEIREAEQEQALNAALAAQGNVEASVIQNEQAAAAAASLASQLQAQANALAEQVAEARRQQAEEAARRAAAAPGARDATSNFGFRWPEAAPNITQEFGPTAFQLEPPYSYGGTYYPNFHTGIDFSGGCGTPIYAAGAGVVVASGQPLAPWDSAYGVIIEHGSGVQTWYWHMQPRVVVGPGTTVTSDTVIGFEGSTGMSTGCHVHFAVNQSGGW